MGFCRLSLDLFKIEVTRRVTERLSGHADNDIDIRLRTETEQVINRFIRGGAPLKDLLAYLSHHFGLLRYLPALLSSRQVCMPTLGRSLHLYSQGTVLR